MEGGRGSLYSGVTHSFPTLPTQMCVGGTFLCVPCILAVRPHLPWKSQLAGQGEPLDSATPGTPRQPLFIWTGTGPGSHELIKPPCDLGPVC